MLYSLYLYFYKRYSDKQRYFYFFIVAIFLLDAVGYFVRPYIKVNQIYLYLPVLFISILYFGYFYSFDYKKSKFYHLLLKLLVIGSLIFSIVFQFNEKEFILSNKSILVLILYQLAVSLLWFWYVINNADEQNIIQKQSFWVSCALLIWSVFALFRFFPLLEIGKLDREFYTTIANIFSVINIITYLLYLRGLRATEYNILKTFNNF